MYWIKKNKISLSFCKEWIKLTEIDFNRNQITKFDNFKDFKWHSQDNLLYQFFLSLEV